MVAALCLALVVVVSAAATTAAPAGQEAVKPMCQVPNNVTACVRQIQDLKAKNQLGTKLLSPDCCRQLTEQFGCACVLRNALKDANLLDIQEPFCVKGTACE
nr:unnamed protein product [Digitaria exilis]